MNIAGTKYDEVTTRLGDGWRMPTKAELQELIDKCKWTLYEKEGIKGYIVTGPSGKSILLFMIPLWELNLWELIIHIFICLPKEQIHGVWEWRYMP